MLGITGITGYGIYVVGCATSRFVPARIVGIMTKWYEPRFFSPQNASDREKVRNKPTFGDAIHDAGERAAKNARSEKPCAVYTHPHAGKNCRCIKLCTNCGRSEEAHLEEAMEMAVQSLTETIEQIQAANTYGRHAISGGEYTTIEGITYSIAPQGPNCLKYRSR